MHRFTLKSRRLAALALAGGLLFIAVLVWMVYSADSGPKLTLAEAEQRVLNTYEGSVVDSRLQGADFVVFLKTGQGLYELIVRSDSGDIAEIRRLEEYAQEPPTMEDDPEGTVPGKDDLSADPSAPWGEDAQEGGASTPGTDGFISEKEATGLALKTVSGLVKDIDIEEDGGTRYYLIEIETADGREAEVQLNAASGKVISVTWDDDTDDDDS
ncbi:PepSY domain-containing protein [Paenibacillus brevis]|uniref:PepSY domain-containing protein n=1 Tax=Paenibacillus brevis TaxID=2841508 RepID=A0ABS6FPZ4_9BACL|nr:PepSY domain-containing protein [Paenibacillus brevis]MBU5672231.1 PepSY domain-containing protein [Paenibacillus brevis]